MNLGLQQFPAEGFWLHRFTDEELLPVRQAVDAIQQDFSQAELSQDKLAGQIKHEYTLDNDTKSYLCATLDLSISKSEINSVLEPTNGRK
jgi:hypothetical protein